MVCEGITGRLEVAEELLKVLNLTESIKLTPVESSHFIEEYFAERPSSERLIDSKLNLRNVNIMRTGKFVWKNI